MQQRVGVIDDGTSGTTRAQTATGAAPADRLLFIDNVRWVMILLVLGMHAAVTYSPVGSWYYREHPHLGAVSTLFFVTFQGVLQGFFMALLFFVAGYFTPKSCDAKGSRRFMTGRFYRLGLPTALFVFAIGPLTEFYVSHSWRTHESFVHEMGLYLLRGQFLSGTGPMWFCAALLIFTCAYVAWRATARARAPARPIRPDAAGVAAAIAAMALSTFLVRFSMPIGSSVLNMQLCYFPSYIMMFALGVAAYRGAWIERISDRFAWTVAGSCVGVAMLAWLPMLMLGGALSGRFDAFTGGPHWQAAALSLWEALICVGMSFGVLAGFRTWFPDQGRVSRFLSDNAFAVYVIHPPILIGIALWLSPAMIQPVAKFALLWAVSALACFALAAPLARRTPLVGRIL